MKRLKAIVSLMLLAAMLVSAFCLSAAATSQQSVTYLDDGSYYVTTLTVFPCTRSTNSTTSGQKTRDYYNSSNEKLYSITVIGTFTYTGSKATATHADYDYSIDKSGYSFSNGTATCSGASVTASGTFRALLTPSTASVTLTCSANGSLS